MLAAIAVLVLVCIFYVLYVEQPSSAITPEQQQSWLLESPEDTGRFQAINNTFYQDTQTARAFTWATPLELAGSDVLIAPMGETGPELADARTVSGEVTEELPDLGLAWHKVMVDDLVPGSRYWYRVGDAQAGVWGPIGHFATAAAQQSAFSFVCISDSHIYSENSATLAADTLRYALNTAPDAAFVVHGGDIPDSGDDENSWLAYFAGSQRYLLDYAVVPTAGNHDGYDHDGVGFFNRHFFLAQPNEQDTSHGVYYSFGYGKVHFVVLNTNEKSDEYGWISAEQAQWLTNTITQAKKNGAQRVVVSLHVGPFALSTHADENRVEGMRVTLAGLLEELEVDLVLQGHDHYLSRTQALRGQRPDETGTTYMTNCASANKFYEFNDELEADYYDLFAYYTDPSREAYRPSFIVVSVGDDGGITTKAYEIDREKENPVVTLVDEHTLPAA